MAAIDLQLDEQTNLRVKQLADSRSVSVEAIVSEAIERLSALQTPADAAPHASTTLAAALGPIRAKAAQLASGESAAIAAPSTPWLDAIVAKLRAQGFTL